MVQASNLEISTVNCVQNLGSFQCYLYIYLYILHVNMNFWPHYHSMKKHDMDAFGISLL